MSMFFRLKLFLGFILAVFSKENVFDISDPQFIQKCVEEHNLKRSNVIPSAANMRYMHISMDESCPNAVHVKSNKTILLTWDASLAVTARAWARLCLFKHNVHLREKGKMHPSFTSVGENIWAGAPYSSFNIKAALGAWFRERDDYNYQSNKCLPGKECGHYTQVVWAESYKVGCAVQTCPYGVTETHFSTQPGIIFICNYATAGNFIGVAPYKEGTPCSSCGREKCENTLCRNSSRDAELKYNWTPDWDPALSSCGWECVTLLCVRLLSIPLLLLSVYCLQIHLKPFSNE